MTQPRFLNWGPAIPLACVAAACVRRSTGWDPPSLWLDDQWMALALRHSNLEQIYALHLPAPLGFTWLAKLTQGWSPDLEWPFQVVPFVAGLLAIPAFWLAARQLVRDRVVLAVMCLYVACHPTAELYSVRVKHYTVDLLITSSLLALLLAVLRRPSLRRYLGLCALAGVSALLSFASALFSLSMLHAFALDRFARARALRQPQSAAGYIAGALALTLWILALYGFFFAAQSSPAMKAFWQHRYLLSFESLRDVGQFFVHGFLGFFVSAVSPIFSALLVLVVIGLRQLARDLELRALAWSFGILCAGMLMGAMLNVYPMGPERTGLFAAPLIWLIAAAGADAAARWLTQSLPRRRGAWGLAAVLVGLCLFRPTVRYSDVRDRQAVEAMQRALRAGDVILTNQFGRLALAHYGGHPVRLVPAKEVSHNFLPLMAGLDVHVLPLFVHGVQIRAEPARADPVLAAIFNLGRPRILYLSTHASEPLDEHIASQAERHGYATVRRIDESPRARLFIFARREPSADAAARAPRRVGPRG